MNLVSIDKLILKEDGTNDLSFNFCQSLEHIRFEGAIGTSLNLKWSGKLTGESVQSIIDHLKDLTGATAQTLTFHATVGTAMTEEQKYEVRNKNWNLVY
jgi:hypothetical protein